MVGMEWQREDWCLGEKEGSGSGRTVGDDLYGSCKHVSLFEQLAGASRIHFVTLGPRMRPSIWPLHNSTAQRTIFLEAGAIEYTRTGPSALWSDTCSGLGTGPSAREKFPDVDSGQSGELPETQRRTTRAHEDILKSSPSAKQSFFELGFLGGKSWRPPRHPESSTLEITATMT